MRENIIKDDNKKRSQQKTVRKQDDNKASTK